MFKWVNHFNIQIPQQVSGSQFQMGSIAAPDASLWDWVIEISWMEIFFPNKRKCTQPFYYAASRLLCKAEHRVANPRPTSVTLLRSRCPAQNSHLPAIGRGGEGGGCLGGGQVPPRLQAPPNLANSPNIAPALQVHTHTMDTRAIYQPHCMTRSGTLHLPAIKQ